MQKKHKLELIIDSIFNVKAKSLVVDKKNALSLIHHQSRLDDTSMI